MRLRHLYAIATLVLTTANVRAALTTNSWNHASGTWVTGADWDHGLPSAVDALDAITIVVPVGSRVITVDAAAVSSNVIDGCLTISNLTIGGTSSSPNTLFLNTNASSTPGNEGLTIRNALTITSHGIVSITNSYLYTGGGGVSDDGVIVLNTGTLDTTPGPTFIGNNGTGQMTVQAGTWQVNNIFSDIQIGNNMGSQGTLTIAGGTVGSVSETHLYVGSDAGGAGTLWLTGGELNVQQIVIGSESGGSGRMIVSNGMWNVSFGNVGSQGTLTIAGGSGSGSLWIGESSGPAATVWMTGGQWLCGLLIGLSGNGQMVMSNGLYQGYVVAGVDESEGFGYPGTGTVTIVGGTNIFSALALGTWSNCLGSVWLTGGLLTSTNYPAQIGGTGNGRMTVSNGTWLANEIDIGWSLPDVGTLTVAGGQVFATNGVGRIMVGGTGLDQLGGLDLPNGSGEGRMYVGGGSVVTRRLDVASDYSPRGDLTVSGSGSITVQSVMTVGDCVSNGFGIVEMTGGKLSVTNAAHNAVLEIRNGLFLLGGGTLVVDKLVVTNGCYGVFDNFSGTVTVGTLVLDPNGDADGDGLPNWWEQAHGLDPLSSIGDDGADGDPDGDGYSNWEEYEAGSDPQNPLSTPLQITPQPLQITSIAVQGNSIVLTWTTAGGSTNQVQVTPGDAGGVYSTNGFINLGPQMIIPGSGLATTNYTDTGGATNRPARYYRVRLVP